MDKAAVDIEVEIITGFCNLADEVGVEGIGSSVEEKATVGAAIIFIVGETGGVEKYIFDASNPYPASSGFTVVGGAVDVASVNGAGEKVTNAVLLASALCDVSMASDADSIAVDVGSGVSGNKG
jgi:hypothetical protein